MAFLETRVFLRVPSHACLQMTDPGSARPRADCKQAKHVAAINTVIDIAEVLSFLLLRDDGALAAWQALFVTPQSFRVSG